MMCSMVAEVNTEEAIDMGSFNHSYIQAAVTRLLFDLKTYTVLTDLSIEINGVEYRPDVCLYPRRTMNPARDIVRMTEMPLLVIEVLSPTQGVQDVLDKSKVYFEAGITSCWLIYPSALTVVVYASPDHFTSFSGGDVIDEKMDIRLPLREMFGL